MGFFFSSHRFLVSTSIAVGLLPLSYDLPVWLIAICLASLFLGMLLEYHSKTAVSNWLRIFLLIGGTAASLAVKGGETWMGLLAVMLSIKPLEGNSYRHMMTGAVFTYFLIASGVLFHQELGFGLYVLLAILYNTFVILRLNHSVAPLKSQLGFMGRIFVRALPVAILLFLLFPRLPGPLWGYRADDSAVTGFSDRLSPGEFANLVHDRSAAFRVEFQDAYPDHESLYWRGLVLWQNDGLHWKRGIRMPFQSKHQQSGEGLLEYTVIMEPHNKRWLFGLDLPVRISVPAVFRIDHSIIAHQRVKRKVRYAMTSSTAVDIKPLKDWERQFALQLPAGNSKARKLATDWSAAADNPADVVAMGLKFFRDQGFVYTTEYQPLQEEARVDDFLFRTRKGYCEHYAGAFAFLMRAAGLPARVVTGYQGGEFNSIGGYLVVRQADAHAWTEVWLPGRGWQRVDPTTVVSPARLSEGVEAALPAEERLDPSVLTQLFSNLPFFTSLSMTWDAMNTIWDNWIISYTLSRQQTLFKIFGLDRSFRYTAVVALLAACSMALLVAVILQYLPLLKTDRPTDTIRKSYNRFCKKLGHIGLPRKKWQGPRGYAEEIVLARPDLGGPVREITRLYEDLHYARKGDSTEVLQLKRLIKNFQPQEQK